MIHESNSANVTSVEYWYFLSDKDSDWIVYRHPHLRNERVFWTDRKKKGHAMGRSRMPVLAAYFRRNFPGNYYDRVPGYRSLNCRVCGSRGDRSYLQRGTPLRPCSGVLHSHSIGNGKRHETRDSQRHVSFRMAISYIYLKDSILFRVVKSVILMPIYLK